MPGTPPSTNLVVNAAAAAAWEMGPAKWNVYLSSQYRLCSAWCQVPGQNPTWALTLALQSWQAGRDCAKKPLLATKWHLDPEPSGWFLKWEGCESGSVQEALNCVRAWQRHQLVAVSSPKLPLSGRLLLSLQSPAQMALYPGSLSQTARALLALDACLDCGTCQLLVVQMFILYLACVSFWTSGCVWVGNIRGVVHTDA